MDNYLFEEYLHAHDKTEESFADEDYKEAFVFLYFHFYILESD